MKKGYYSSIPKRLRELFPGFTSDWDDEYVYPILFELFLFVTENVHNYDAEEKLVEFIQEAFDANDFMAKEAVILQIMESAMEDEQLKLYLNNRLSGDVLENFNRLKPNL